MSNLLYYFLPHPTVIFLFVVYMSWCVDDRKAGTLSHIKRLFTVKLFGHLKQAFVMIFGESSVDFIHGIYIYVFKRANPFVQMLYFFCVFVGFGLTLKNVFPHV